MNVLNLLPTFNQVEPNNLQGLYAGLIVAQVPAKSDITKTEDGKYVENGILCTFSADGKEITNWTADKQPLFLHYTEPLNTVISGEKYFAVEYKAGETYLRLVQLVPGSEWTTTIAPEETAYAAAIAANKIKEVDAAATMADGTAAHTYRCIAL